MRNAEVITLGQLGTVTAKWRSKCPGHDGPLSSAYNILTEQCMMQLTACESDKLMALGRNPGLENMTESLGAWTIARPCGRAAAKH